MKTNLVQSKQERPSTVRLIAIGAILLIAICSWSGCKAKSTEAVEINPVGSYNLVSVDGKALPCPVAHAGSPTVKSGIFIINADGTCNSKIVLSTPSGGEMTREVKATYTRTGATLTMKWTGAGTTTGNVTSDTFTMNNEGLVFAYRK